jgi:hypothetical protein
MTFIRPFRLNYIGTANYLYDTDHIIGALSISGTTVIRCAGTLTLDGVLNGAGGGYNGDDGPNRGSIGGYYMTGGDEPSYGGRGGGAGRRDSGPLHSLLSGDLRYLQGSGGGKGGPTPWGDFGNWGPGYGAPGGKGGAGLLTVSDKLVITPNCVVNLSGSNGGTSPGGIKGWGGGGAGGTWIALANVIELPGSGTIFIANGGVGGSIGDARDGENGEAGAAYFCYTRSITGDVAARTNPDAVVIDLSAHSILLG